MGRPRRFDPRGGWHHIWGRGIAKKPIFENRADIRRFQAALARAVRRGDLEVHSFVFLTTHFHLLVRSPSGRLSQALGRVLWDFTCHYNRSRDRDGTVWRGRFCSKPVLTYRYRRILVRYIDLNPVQAGLATTPWTYEHGSARRFLTRTPKWLSRTWVDAEILGWTGKRPEEGGRYEVTFPPTDAALLSRLVEARAVSCAKGADPLDDLVAAAPARVRRWMETRSILADNTKPGHPVVDPETVMQVIAAGEGERPLWRVRPRHKYVSGYRVAQVVLLRDLSGQTYLAIARRVAISATRAKDLYHCHRGLLAADEEYARILLSLAMEALRRVDGHSSDLCLAQILRMAPS